MVGGAIDTIGFIALFGFHRACDGNLVLAGAAWVKGGSGLWIKLAAIPLFILTVVITKLLIDRSQAKQKRLIYFYLKLFFYVPSWWQGFTSSHLKIQMH